jgi:hypothetical protein
MWYRGKAKKRNIFLAPDRDFDWKIKVGDA